MYVCICMHVCMHVCMCVCIYICIHVCIYVRMNVCRPTYVCVYVCMYVSVCMYAIRMYIHTHYTHNSKYVCIRMHVFMYRDIYIYTCISNVSSSPIAHLSNVQCSNNLLLQSVYFCSC